MRKLLFMIVAVIMMLGSLTGSVWAAGLNNIPATGLKEPTAAQSAWIKKNFPVIKDIHLNQIALDRINQDRGKKGLNRLSKSDVNLAPPGQESSFATGATSDGQTNTGFTSALPNFVDNSASPAFPPIRSQGGIGSCVAWATTYYQFTYETNLAYGRVAASGDNNVIFSPKWTYNMINDGIDAGAYFSEAYAVELKNGAANWAEFPYDTNYLTWCLNPNYWREALNYRPLSWGQIINTNTDLLISDIKTQLCNGHILVIATYVSSWTQKLVGNDASITDDDAYVNQKIAAYMKNTKLGGHAMTLVGYNDNLWCDLNSNGVVDNGEKGAFKIANSWGTGDWNSGYRWVAYDALRSTSAVSATSTWPTSDRASSGIFWAGNIFTLTVTPDSAPNLVAKVTLNSSTRGQIVMSLGTGSTTSTKPTASWSSGAIDLSGGNYAFDGTTTAVDGTFFFDFSDLAAGTAGSTRWFVGVYDSTFGGATNIKSYELYLVQDTGDVLVGTSTDLPKSVDGSQTYSWVDYDLNSVANQSPLAVIKVSSTSGSIPFNVDFDGSASSDSDGSIVNYAWDFGDGATGAGSQVSHIYVAAGTFAAKLTVTDDQGASGTNSVTIKAINPDFIRAPTNLTGKVNRKTVTLNWKDNSNNENGFYIERAVKNSKGVYSTFARVGQVTVNVHTYTQTVAANTYLYRVQAYNKATGKVSGYSNSVSLRVN